VVYLRSENQRVVLIDGWCLDLAEHVDYIDRRDREIADSFVLRRPDFGDIEGLNAAPRRSRPEPPGRINRTAVKKLKQTSNESHER